MEKITKKEFLKRCVDADASTNVDSLTKEIVRSEIFVFDYYIKNNFIYSVATVDNNNVIITNANDNIIINEEMIWLKKTKY